MKYVLIILIFSGCSRTADYSIVSKMQTKDKCICLFEYNTFDINLPFEDSCNKYSVGDTIHFK